MPIADISRTRVLARAVRALAGATLAVRPVEDADMLSDLFLLEQPIQHRRGGECRKRLPLPDGAENSEQASMSRRRRPAGGRHVAH